jgi:hypothetical protein
MGFRIDSQLSRWIVPIAMLLSFCAHAQVPKIEVNTPTTFGETAALTWGAYLENNTCPDVPPAYISSISVASGAATVHTNGSLISSGSCSDPTGDSITVANTFSCLDGIYTVATAASVKQTYGVNGIYTFATTCTDSFTQLYEQEPEIIKDKSGTLWGFWEHGANAGESMVYRTSVDEGRSWSNQATAYGDTNHSCSGDMNCEYAGPEVGIAPNGNVVMGYAVYDFLTQQILGLVAGSWDGSSWSTPYPVTTPPPGQTSWTWCGTTGSTQIFSLPGGAMGLFSQGIAVTNPTDCSMYTLYLLISCDNGETWGTGTGCRGKMARYASSPIREIGPSTSIPTSEGTMAWIGGKTLLGFFRNNPWSSTCTAPCGPMIEVVSNDLGHTWRITPTNIVGSSVGSPTLTSYTEVSPYLMYSGFGDLWTLFYGDRNNSASQNNQILRYITFDAHWASWYPASLAVGQSIFSQNGVIGVYPSAVKTSCDHVVILFDYESYAFQVREIFQLNGKYVSSKRRRCDMCGDDFNLTHYRHFEDKCRNDPGSDRSALMH